MSAENLSGEVEYRAIPDLPGYRIGSDGSVWSCWAKRGRGNLYGSESYISDAWKPLKLFVDKDGYRFVSLRRNGRYHKWRVHRLVLVAFVGPCPEGMNGAHNNGRPDDNRLENLRWATHLDNCHDKELHGTDQRGERHGCSLITADDVRSIRRLVSSGMKQREVGVLFGIKQPTVSAIARRKLWAHVA